MVTQEALDIIRARTNDVDAVIFTDTELVHYVNMGISTVANQMIAAGNPCLVKTLSVPAVTGIDIPDDFHSMAPSEAAYITDGRIFLDGGATGAKPVRYFSVPPSVASVSDPIPFPAPYVPSVVNVAVELAAMRIGKDVNQERQGHMVMGNMRTPFQSALGSIMGQVPPPSGGGGSADKG